MKLKLSSAPSSLLFWKLQVKHSMKDLHVVLSLKSIIIIFMKEVFKSPKKNENKTNLNTKCHLLQNADTTL